MPDKHTPPPWRKHLLGRWRALAKSTDPVEEHVGKALLAEYRQARRADAPREQDDRPPARWPMALNDLADQEPRTWTGQYTFKTSHAAAHSSRSGTCMSVDLERGLWFCSSCRAGGDAIGWLRYHEHLAYQTAAARLMVRYG